MHFDHSVIACSHHIYMGVILRTQPHILLWAVFFSHRPKCFWNDQKKLSHFCQKVWKYRLMNTLKWQLRLSLPVPVFLVKYSVLGRDAEINWSVMPSFNTTVRHMTEMYQQKLTEMSQWKVRFVVNCTFNTMLTERLQQHPLLFTTNHTNRTFFLRLHLARPSHPGHSTILLWLESPSGKCTKLPTVAASNNRDNAPRSLLWLAQLNYQSFTALCLYHHHQ